MGQRRFTVAVFSSVVMLAGCGASTPPPSQRNPLLANIMPSFEGKTLNMTPFDSGQGSGHPMVIKFFSTECKRCQRTLPALQRIYEDNPGIVMVGVSEDESVGQARRLVEGLGVRFPVIHDSEGRLAKQYSVEDMPVTFVMSKNGTVRWVGGPDQTEDGVRAAVSAAED
jgi:peroxiredoxin